MNKQNQKPQLPEAARAFRNAYQREINRRNRQKYQTRYWIRKAEQLQADLKSRGYDALAEQLQNATGEELNQLTEQALQLVREGGQA